MTFNDTCDIGNILSVPRQHTEDVVYVGRFDMAVHKLTREPIPCAGVEALRFAITMFLAKYDPRAL